jgi:molybdopterin synthase catalytic subunit
VRVSPDHAVLECDAPSTSGNIVVRARIATEPIDATHHTGLVASAAAGAVVTFAGIVRDHDGGRSVALLEYSAHPYADAVIAEVAAEVTTGVEGVRAIALSHRVGRLEVGETALVCAVAADHRGTAFAVCTEAVEAVKRRLPVWKRQVFTDGTDEWVGSA